MCCQRLPTLLSRTGGSPPSPAASGLAATLGQRGTVLLLVSHVLSTLTSVALPAILDQRVVLLSTAAALPHPGAPPIVAGNVPAGQVRVEEGELAGTTLVGFSARNEERLALLRFAGAAEDPLVSTNQGKHKKRA